MIAYRPKVLRAWHAHARLGTQLAIVKIALDEPAGAHLPRNRAGHRVLGPGDQRARGASFAVPRAKVLRWSRHRAANLFIWNIRDVIAVLYSRPGHASGWPTPAAIGAACRLRRVRSSALTRRLLGRAPERASAVVALMVANSQANRPRRRASFWCLFAGSAGAVRHLHLNRTTARMGLSLHLLAVVITLAAHPARPLLIDGLPDATASYSALGRHDLHRRRSHSCQSPPLVRPG